MTKSHTAGNGRTQESLCCLLNIRLPARVLSSMQVHLSLQSFVALVKAERLLGEFKVQGDFQRIVCDTIRLPNSAFHCS